MTPEDEQASEDEPPTSPAHEDEASNPARGQAVGPPTSPTGDGEALTPARGHRLQKVLAQVGFGSRRVCDDLIADGLVTVNGEVAELGRRVDPEVDRVEVDGIPVGIRPGLVHYLLNKPAGVVTTAADTHGRPTVVELVPAEPRVFPVGRLDLDTEGLLLLTNDGDLAHRVTHPSHGVEKEYLAEVASPPSRAALRQLREGVDLDDGPTAPARVALVAPTLVRLTIHGMPLGALCGVGDRRLIDLGWPGAKIRPEDVVLIGVRDLDGEEAKLMRKAGVTVYTMKEVDHVGLPRIAEETLARLGKLPRLHVSFDADVLDPEVAPGVGTPVPGGFTYREAHLLMELFADSGHVTSLDLVEVNPILDRENRTANTLVELAASLLAERAMAVLQELQIR